MENRRGDARGFEGEKNKWGLSLDHTQVTQVLTRPRSHGGPRKRAQLSVHPSKTSCDRSVSVVDSDENRQCENRSVVDDRWAVGDTLV